MTKYIIRKSFDGKYRWFLIAPNGDNLLTSEAYTSKEACLNGVQISKESLKDSNFKMLMTAKNINRILRRLLIIIKYWPEVKYIQRLMPEMLHQTLLKIMQLTQ